MVKIAIDVIHESNISGNKLPDGDHEWLCNDKVVSATIDKLKTYKDVEILRLDDSSGDLETSLNVRNNRAREWKADIYVTIHNNMGIENRRKLYSIESLDNIKKFPENTYPRIVRAMGKRNGRTIQMNFHVLRESLMPVILKEGGFVNSSVDIIKICNNNLLMAEGEAIADGLAAYIKLEPINDINPISSKAVNNDLIQATITVLQYLESSEQGVVPEKWLKQIQNRTLNESDAIGLLYVALHRWLSK